MVVYLSAWNSSPLVREVTKRGKKKQMLTPMTFSLIHATDFADRTEHDIIPPLKAGAVVLADRYSIRHSLATSCAESVRSGCAGFMPLRSNRPSLSIFARRCRWP